MNIHEYQAKELLKGFGVDVPRGIVAHTAKEAENAARELGGGTVVVKAQIHAGGRGKGGGVKIVHSPEEAGAAASEILGMQLITHQTGPEGKTVHKVLVEEGADIARELYLGMVIDRSTERVVIMASSEGGMEIEEVAANTPEKIHMEYVDPATGFVPYQGRKIAYFLGLEGKTVNQAVRFIAALYNAFVSSECALAEINPLIVTGDGAVKALDAKINFDDNALFRYPANQEMMDKDEENPTELEAKEWNLSYVQLDGNIGCLVNGAGLAMATMDIIKYYGGEPANFLDVGGGASTEQVTQAFKMILRDSKVKAVLVNIFGGIMKCDTIANGIISAAKEVGIKVPLFVRLEGTNVDLGVKILSESGLDIGIGADMREAARKAVEAVNGTNAHKT